jgi:glucose-6-phosphate 1-dehydrogenase
MFACSSVYVICLLPFVTKTFISEHVSYYFVKKQPIIGSLKQCAQKSVTLVIFGGTGDLTKRKLVPALSGLVEDGLLSPKSLIVGVARRDHTDDSYRDFLLSDVTCQLDRDCISHAQIKYYQKDSSKAGALRDLVKMLDDHDLVSGCESQRIFYLATSYDLFEPILQNIRQEGLEKKGNAKIVFEKPFGHDSISAKRLTNLIHSVFDEEHVYRIDHYLGKETVQNIIALKFANPLINAIFSKKYIDHIDVFSDETLDVANRIVYYDSSGATRDMIQSHLLQVLSLVLMDEPKSFAPDDLHDAKVRVLRSLRVGSKHVIGQYDSYNFELADAKGLSKNTSSTETFVRMHVVSTLSKWRGVDFFLQTGKALDKKSSKVIIYLKKSELLHGFHFDVNERTDNRIVIDIQPGSDIKIYFNTRKPDAKDKLTRVSMDFCGEVQFGPNTTDGYKLLLEDVLASDKTLFTRDDELRYSWKLIDSFMTLKQNIKLVKYKKGASPFVISGSAKW